MYCALKKKIRFFNAVYLKEKITIEFVPNLCYISLSSLLIPFRNSLSSELKNKDKAGVKTVRAKILF